MVKKGHTLEQIIHNLIEAGILFNQGESAATASKQIGVSVHTYYRLRKEDGSMRVDQAGRLKDLEQKNSQLKQLAADLSLDNVILKESSRSNF